MHEHRETLGKLKEKVCDVKIGRCHTHRFFRSV